MTQSYRKINNDPGSHLCCLQNNTDGVMLCMTIKHTQSFWIPETIPPSLSKCEVLHKYWCHHYNELMENGQFNTWGFLFCSSQLTLSSSSFSRTGCYASFKRWVSAVNELGWYNWSQSCFCFHAGKMALSVNVCASIVMSSTVKYIVGVYTKPWTHYYLLLK